MSGQDPDPYADPYAAKEPGEPGAPPTFQPSYGQPPYAAQPYAAQPYAAQPYAAQPYGAQPGYPAYGAQPGYPPQPGFAYGVPVAPDHPQATTALVLGLLGLVGGVMCLLPLLAAPFAWWIGARTRREIDAQPGLGGRGQATAGMITGIIGTVLLALGVAFVILVVVLAATGNLDDSGTSGYDGTNATGRLR